MRAATTPLLHRPHLWLGLLIYWALGQVGKRMNQYGTRAKEHWQHHRPQAYAALTNPEEYFTQMGEEIATAIAALTPTLAGPDLPGEAYLDKVARVKAATRQAEEIAIAESPMYATPELTFSEWEDTTPDTLDALLAWVWARRSELEGLDEQAIATPQQAAARFLVTEDLLTQLVEAASPWDHLQTPPAWTAWTQSVQDRWRRDSSR